MSDVGEFGVQVPGTHLNYLGPAPRTSPTDRNRMGRYQCRLCGAKRALRVKDVRPDHTVSCGCHGALLNMEYKAKRASNHRPAPPRLSKDLEALLRKVEMLKPTWAATAGSEPLMFRLIRCCEPGWHDGLSAKEWKMLDRYFEGKWLALEKEERRESLFAASHNGFRTEEQRRAWLRSKDPRMRLEARAGGWGKSATLAMAELELLRDKERGCTREEYAAWLMNGDIEIG